MPEVSTTINIVLAILSFVLTILGTILIIYFKEIKEDVKGASSSIHSMSLRIEAIFTDQSWHKEKIENHESRIQNLEHR